MLSQAFLLHRYPKKNADWVVEECTAISTYHLPRRDGRPYLPQFPDTRIEAVKSGACVRFYFQCPRCARLVETLFLPPGPVEPADWRSEIGRLGYACRRCHRLVYASQRYGRDHPLRYVLTSRKGRRRVFGKPYLSRRSVIRKGLYWLGRPEPKSARKRYEQARAIIDASEVLSRPRASRGTAFASTG